MGLAPIIKVLLDRYYQLLRVAIGLLLGLMIIPVLLQIVSRYSPLIPRFIWTEEIARFCFVWIIMIGASIAVRDESHFDVDLLPQPETDRQRGFARLVVHVAMASLAAVFAWYGIEFAKFGYLQSSEMWGINMLSIYISFPLAGITWLLFLGEKIVDDMRLLFPTDSMRSLEHDDSNHAPKSCE